MPANESYRSPTTKTTTFVKLYRVIMINSNFFMNSLKIEFQELIQLMLALYH